MDPADEVRCLAIGEPRPQYLKVECVLGDIIFGHNSLSKVEIHIVGWEDNEHVQASECSSNLQEFFAHLPLI